MHKRYIAGILLAALLVSLCGCTSVFDKEYLSVRSYEEPSNLLTDADTTQIRNYAGLMRALNTMAAQYERSFVLAFGDYDGIIADDLAAACEELRTGTAIGAYCIESVSYETEQVIAYCESEEEFNTQMQALHQDLIAYNQLYDIYNDYAGVVNVKAINDNAGKAPVQVDDRILSMLELARQMYDLTGGKINIAMGSVLGIWHDHREAAEKDASETDNTLPTQEELEAAAQHCDINGLVIDEDAKTVYLSDPEMSLDVGSVGKGYAVEMVCRAAEARGLTSALVSVGGNLRAIGTKPDGSQWTGGVENPWNASEVYTNTSSIFGSPINMSDLALVTSGDYQRYFVVDGKRYHHIIDPRSGYPADSGLTSVTIVSDDGTLADGLSTSLFIMGHDAAIDYWRTHSEDFDFILVSDDGSVTISAGLEDCFTLAGDRALEVVQ